MPHLRHSEGMQNRGKSMKKKRSFIERAVSMIRKIDPLAPSTTPTSVLSKAAKVKLALGCLIAQDGEGSWPPKSVFEDDWPQSLKPYAALCDLASTKFVPDPPEKQEQKRENIDEVIAEGTEIPALCRRKPSLMVPAEEPAFTVSQCPGMQKIKKQSNIRRLVSEVSSLENAKDTDPTHFRIRAFRKWMEKTCNSQLPELHDVMADVEQLNRPQKNGFICCLSFLLHMYRWGISPIVECAQIETKLVFPPSLWEPFTFLCDDLGQSRSGTIYSMHLVNTIRDNSGNFRKTRFLFNDTRFPLLHSTEENFIRLFVELEEAASLIFHTMTRFLTAIENRSSGAAICEIQTLSQQADSMYKIFFHWLRDDHIKYQYWLPYVQGPSGWGIDGIDGLTGAHTLCIPAMDAFLGLRGTSSTWHFTLEHRHHMTKRMRGFLKSLSEFQLADVLSNHAFDHEIYVGYEYCVQKLRSYRKGHKFKVLPYFKVKADERLPMTAGGGLITKDKYGKTLDRETLNKEFIEFFKQRLSERVVETVSAVKRLNPLPYWFSRHYELLKTCLIIFILVLNLISVSSFFA